MSEGTSFELEARELGLELDGRAVLKGIDARFTAGRVHTIVGPSGAGKTSLLRCLNRLAEPTAGSVLLDGLDVREIPPTELRQKVGMIFQTPVIFSGGVRANLTYGFEADDEACSEALQRSGLPPDFLERDSNALSVGQAQRVTIARALVRRPEALLLDEPTSALDKDAARRIEELIGQLAASGLIIVVVTHDLQQAVRVGDEALLLHDGRVCASGAPEDVASAWPEEVS